MKKKLLSAILSISLLASVIPVYAQNSGEEGTSVEPFYTDRFIIETKEYNSSITEETNVPAEEVETTINEILADMNSTTETADITTIENSSNVITLTEEVNATEFVRSMEESMGKDIESIQPDYPVYLNTLVNNVEETESETSGNDSEEPNYQAWEENLVAAQALSTGAGARIAILGKYYNKYNSNDSYIVDVQNFVEPSSNIYSSNYITTEDKIISIIHNVASSANIIPIGVFSEDNNSSNSYKAYTSDIVKGIQYAQNNGAQVLVCDWYTDEYNEYLEKKMNESSLLFVTAAGAASEYNHDYYNTTSYDKLYPACFDVNNMLTVSALYENYNKMYEVNYDDAIDIYAVGSYTYTQRSNNYSINNASSATAYLAGAAALVIGKNNSSANLKNIILNSAFNVSYLPGTKRSENYKALSFYDAVMGNTSNETIEISTARGSRSYSDQYITDIQKVYYADIKQVVAGTYGIAILLNDGTVKVCSSQNTTPTTPSGNYYYGLECYGRFATINGFSKNSTIERIAISSEGYALAAVDSNGDVYVLGKKAEWGEGGGTSSGSEAYLAPQKIEGVEHATDVYLTRNTMFVKTTENNTDKLLSRGEYTHRSGSNYEFAEITEAAGYTDIDFNGGTMAFVKDGKAYVSNSSSSSDGYFQELSVDTSAAVTDVELMSNVLYIRTADKTLYSAELSDSSLSTRAFTANVEKIAASSNMLLVAKDNSNNSIYDNYVYWMSSPYSEYPTSISINADIDCICEFGSTSSTPSNYTEVYNGTYILTNDRTLYRGDVYNSNSGSGYYPTSFRIVAQKNFTAQAIDSIVPANIEAQYGSDYLDEGIDAILAAETDGKVTITLADGTDVVVPVTWNTTGFDRTKLGTQTFSGTLSLPQGITQPEGANAVANVTIKAPVTEVQNIEIKAEYDETKEQIISRLSSEVEVTTPIAKEEKDKLSVTWDTSKFEPQPGNTYTIYGHIQTNDEICNPYDKVSVATVTVGDTPKPDDISIISIDAISKNANEGLLLNIGTKPNIGENPQTLVDVPNTVSGHTNEGNISLNVVWDDSNYNPFNVGIAQRITGTVEVPEGYALASGVEPILYVTVLPRTYSVISTVPETPETTVLGGSSISDVNDSITDHKIGVEAIDESDSSVVYFFAPFEVIADNNEEYNPDAIGVQTVNGNFTRSNITLFDEGYIPVDVDVVSSPIDIVSTAEVNTYQSVSLADATGIPDTVNITLENDMAVTAGVEWDFANYQKDIAGDQIITGRLVNLPSGVIQSNPERVATLIIHVTAVSYKIISADTPQETVYAKTEIEDLADNLSSDTISVELESITDGITLITTYDMPFAISEDDNTDYDSEFPDLYIINGQFTLPSNISNPDDVLCQIFLEVEALNIVSIEPLYAATTRGTAFADIDKPAKTNVTLSDGSVEQIDVDWGTGTGYISDSPELTEDHSIQSTVYGTLTNVPAYINYFNEPVSLTITVTKPRVYYISSIAPARIPTTGSITLNLGSSLADIYNAIDSHTATLSLVDGDNNAVEGITVNFTIEESDNASYSPTTLGEQTVVAHLVLPENIQNPNNVQLPIVVNLIKRTVRSATVVRLTNIPYGTSFEDLGLPENAPVQFTDNTTGALPTTWNSSTYNPNKVGAQVIRGTFNTPLPIYAENPNNRQPVAAVTIVQANTNIISAEPMETVQTENIMTRRLSAPRYTVLSNSIETDEIPGLRIRNYNVTMQHEDGSITTEIIPVFETVE